MSLHLTDDEIRKIRRMMIIFDEQYEEEERQMRTEEDLRDVPIHGDGY